MRDGDIITVVNHLLKDIKDKNGNAFTKLTELDYSVEKKRADLSHLFATNKELKDVENELKDCIGDDMVEEKKRLEEKKKELDDRLKKLESSPRIKRTNSISALNAVMMKKLKFGVKNISAKRRRSKCLVSMRAEFMQREGVPRRGGRTTF